MNRCPCGTQLSYENCCQPLHDGKAIAQSPAQLMRSRYCAFVKQQSAYIYLTHSPETRHSVSVESINEWNSQCDWCGLQLVTSTNDTLLHQVEFIAWYQQAGKLNYHHELSQFLNEPLDDAFAKHLQEPKDKNNEKVWYYASATYPDRKIALPKRNDECICNSGQKFKKCCG